MIPGKTMTGADENRHYLRAFIHTYRDQPILWDTALRDYTNRDKRAESYEKLVPIYRYLKRDATVEDVKKKINTLRTNYRKELKVVECARRSGTIHQPRCWTFHELDFLRNIEKFLAINPNSIKNDSFSFNNENSQTSSYMDAPTYNFRTILTNNTIQPGPPSITEMFQKSFGQHAQKLEPQHTPPPQPSASSTSSLPLSHTSTFSTPSNSNATQHELATSTIKRQRLSPQPSTNAATTNSQNTEELLNIACDYLSSTYPEEESIARTWAHKLKRMQREQRLLAEKFVNEILFEGESGTLYRGSVQINSFEPFVRFEEQHNEENHTKTQSPSVHTSTPTTPALPSESEGKNAITSKNVTETDTNFGNYN